MRPPSGNIQVLTDERGLRTFRLRFRADGRRESIRLHEDPYCDCGCGANWTIAKAQRELENTLARVRAGVWSPPEPPDKRSTAEQTFAGYAEQWLRRWIAGEFGSPPRPSTIADYRDWRLRQHLTPFFGATPLAAIDRQSCARFKTHKLVEAEELRDVIAAGGRLRRDNGMPMKPLSKASIAKLIRLLAQILEQAVDDALLDSNPARGHKMRLQVSAPVRTFLEADELADLLDAAGELDRGVNPLTLRVKALSSAGERPPAIAREVGISVPTVYYHLARLAEPSSRSRGHARAVVAALAYSGLRVSELINLRWRDVHLHAGRLHVTGAKTPRGVREVELTPVLREELIDLRAASQSEGAKLGPDAFVFATSR
jgi:integrase